MAYYAIEPPKPWTNIEGKPYITVSAKGIANGLSDIPNDGADFGPDTPGTQTSGIQEAVNYVGYTGRIYLRNGTYNINTQVYLPALFLSGGTTPSLVQTNGQVVQPPPVQYIDLEFIGESKDGVVIYHGDGTSGKGGFNWNPTIVGALVNPINTRYVFENMTWMPNPNYPTGGHVSPIVYCNMMKLVCSTLIFKHMRLEGKIGQWADLSIWTGSMPGYGGYLNYLEDVQIRYIPGINLNPSGRTLIIIKNLDLWNSGYTDNAFAINTNDTSGEGLVIIDGLIAGQDTPPPSTGFTAGGSALFMLASGYSTATGGPNTNMPVIGRNINVYPSFTPSNSTFFSVGWNNMDLEIDEYNTKTVIVNSINSKLKLRSWIYSSSFADYSFQFWGSIVNSKLDIDIFNLTGTNLASHYGHIDLNSGNISDSKFRVSVYGNAVATGDIVINNHTSSPTYSNVELDGDFIAQLTNAPNVGISNISWAKISPTIKPSVAAIAQNIGLSTPTVPASGTAQQNTKPFPVKVYISGGAVTQIQITINGTAYTVYSNSTASAVYESFTLPVGASITLTYSTAPTWTWVPE